MASYITITDTETDPEAPITSYLAKRWRDNPIAIAERAAGAPRVRPSTIEVLTGSGNWTVPAGVTRVKVRAVGGGGGGTTAVRGGGGGAYAEGVVNVTPAANIAYVVGAGGAADTDGGDSTFNGGAVFTAGKGLRGGASTDNGGTSSGTNATFKIRGGQGDAAGATGRGGASHFSTQPGGIGQAGTGGPVAGSGADGTIILEY